MPCELMDGRDAFLTMAREKHFEFSSLRRTKYSTMALLYELHTQGQDKFVYTCNSCEQSVETRYHCTICDDFDLCIKCYSREGHPHKMEKLGEGWNSSPDAIQRCIQVNNKVIWRKKCVPKSETKKFVKISYSCISRIFLCNTNQFRDFFVKFSFRRK